MKLKRNPRGGLFIPPNTVGAYQRESGSAFGAALEIHGPVRMENLGQRIPRRARLMNWRTRAAQLRRDYGYRDAHLTFQQAGSFVLRQRGFTFRRIAERLRCSPASAHRHYARAIQKLMLHTTNGAMPRPPFTLRERVRRGGGVR